MEPPSKPGRKMKAPSKIRPRTAPPLADARAAFFAAHRDAVAFLRENAEDRNSTRLNSSHSQISYAVSCLKKKLDLGHRPPRPLHRRLDPDPPADPDAGPRHP